jgi:ABC-type glycerol-3-phosphate transport system substrate-binding protein
MRVKARMIVLQLIMIMSISGCMVLPQGSDPPLHLNVFLHDLQSSNYGGYKHDFYKLKNRLSEAFPQYRFHFYYTQSNAGDNRYVNYAKASEEEVYPDIILDKAWLVPLFLKEGLHYDLTDLIKQYDLDLSSFEPELLNHIRAWGKKGEILALPYSRTVTALHYNKRIFDRFRIPYPSDHMSWDEVLALAERTATSINQGIGVAWLDGLAIQFFIQYVNPETGRIDLSSERWKQALGLWQRIYGLPGNQHPEGNSALIGRDANIAMFAGRPEDIPYTYKDWDLVTYPIFHADSQPALSGSNGLSEVLAVSPTSRYKQEAFQVISYMVSEAFQMENAREGLASSLSNSTMEQEFGAWVPEMANKHTEAYFMNPTVPAPNEIDLYDITLSTVTAAPSLASIYKQPLNLLVEGEESLEQTLSELEKSAREIHMKQLDQFESIQERFRREISRKVQ